ncbi:MAG: tRNA (N6-isopentenyl adenosine(37)-C2)-methylthiotransferase MiaB [Planctomycetota bacterium]|jgi:tRNA-2-methylthio-N6-dimethylallyladenosine synthase|nr:tRNA (N6-isopentenyl adenosine(37)-C2)-methylthiotransferase MiaB [Planctomycetota bacterium]
MTRSFNLRVFGCQMNFYDGELIRAAFLKRGWTETESIDDAQVHMFHTCSVRENAEERVHGLLGELRRLKKNDPSIVIAVIGCMADREGEELFEREPHVDIVCGSRHFPKLPDLVAKVQGGEQRVCLLGESETQVDEQQRDIGGRVASYQAHVAVMRGCDMNCTYCIVPSVRGRVESRPLEAIIDEVKRLAADGVTEVHLLGQTIDSYGRDLPKENRPSLASLIDEIEFIDQIKRIRLVTLHPSYVDEQLAESMARSTKFMRFLPVPIQSGSDPILKAMKRGYTLDLYRKRIKLLKNVMPDIELISDWIVGFPGETDEDHLASEEAMREFSFLQSYVFQYSPRPGTVSHAGDDDIVPQQKARRNHRLLDLQREIAKSKTPQMVGKSSQILIERLDAKNPGYWFGRIHNGHYCLLPHRDGFLPGQVYDVDLVDYNGKSLIAADRLSAEDISVLADNSKPSQITEFSV